MPKVSQLPNKPQPTLADILPLLDVAAGNTKSASLTEIASALIGAIIPTGTVTEFAAAVAPTGWLLCQGQSVLRTDYPNLFTAIGTTFGSVDGTHFTLPDLRGRTPLGVGTATGANGATAHTLGQVGGEETHQLNQAEMPVHSHYMYSYPSGNEAGGYGLAAPGVSQGFADRAFVTAGTGSSTGNTGGGNSHNNLSPYVGMNFIIKT